MALSLKTSSDSKSVLYGPSWSGEYGTLCSKIPASRLWTVFLLSGAENRCIVHLRYTQFLEILEVRKMFEQVTYESIMDRMLSGVRNAAPELDIREGSLIYTAVAPIAAELMQMYIELDTVLNETFADTQSLPFLQRRAAERGIFLKPGETEEQLRRRLLQSLEAMAFGGNIADYVQKVGALPGVGGVRVTPVWQGGGTVLITITDSRLRSPSQSLVERVQSEIDPDGGDGTGIAPIGHSVTVEGAGELAVQVSTTLTLLPGFTLAGRQPLIERELEDYYASLRAAWDTERTTIVRQSGIEQRILAVPGILDVTGTRINGQTGNLTLSPGVLPVSGGLQFV
jgi:uncharacterized phage protein gp47/JayE